MSLPISQSVDPAVKARIDFLCSKLTNNTRLALNRVLKQFWSAGYSLPATPDQVCAFLLAKSEEDVKLSTLQNYAALIIKIHRLALYTDIASAIAVKASTMLNGLKLERIEQGKREARKSAYPLALEDALLIDAYLTQRAATATTREIGMARQDLALFRLLYWSGCRESEVVSLKRWQVKFYEEPNRGIELNWTTTKTNRDITGTGTARFIPSLPNADPFAALADYISLYWPSDHSITPDETFLFIRQKRNGKWNETHLHPNSVPVWLRSIAAKAGVSCAKKLSGHSCRHGLATMMSDKVQLRELMDYFKWKRAATAIGYATNKGVSHNVNQVLFNASIGNEFSNNSNVESYTQTLRFKKA